MINKRFTVRVYGLLIQNNAVLVSDEHIKAMHITKFPGGGVEFGEGTIDALKREFIEELSLKTEVVSHFYTTDFFVASAFDENTQVISLYYIVKALEPVSVPISTAPYDYKLDNNTQAFRWIPLSSISENDFTFVIDKKVGEMLKSFK
ncbi:MAG TPA: NUDIX domain-containing protein [Bacteroidia bacterium]